MRTFQWSIVFLLISAGHLVSQEFDWKSDGNSLLTKCSLTVRLLDGEKLSTSDALESTFCTGYITGSHDTDYMVQMLEEHEKITLMKHSCPPSNASTGQVVRIVVKYLRDNPERLNLPASVLVADAVRNSFPCK